MKINNRSFYPLVVGFAIFILALNSSYAAPAKHCQPNDVACVQSMQSNSKPPASNTPVRTYDKSGKLLTEKIGDTTTYYTTDKNGKQVQVYQETVKNLDHK